MYNHFFWFIISILTLSHVVGMVLDRLNGKRWSDVIPGQLKGIINQEEYSRSQNYYRENKRISNIAATINLFAVILVLSFALFAWVDSFVSSFSSNEIIITLLFFAFFGLATDIGHLPFHLYGPFVIEEKYGFNRTTPKTFMADKLKSWRLGVLLGGPILALITWIFYRTGEWFWIYVWLVVTLFSLFMNFFYSELIVPLFNKQRPLEEGELKDAISIMADRAGFRLKNIYTIDGSKRSTRANAYFTGLGNRKRIVLYDTLINDLTINEIVAVLAHEIGHYRYRHNLIFMLAGIAQTGLMFYIFSLLAGNKQLAAALGSTENTFHITLVAFALIYSPVSFVLSLVMNYISRRHENRADRFAASVAEGEALSSALKKLSVKNLSNLNPHPAYVFFYYSHPPLLSRLKNLAGS